VGKYATHNKISILIPPQTLKIIIPEDGPELLGKMFRLLQGLPFLKHRSFLPFGGAFPAEYQLFYCGARID
jgi:hypothetical protein